MSIFLPETDSEDELPVGWEERATPGGDVYYANHAAKSTQWTHPRTGRKKRLAGSLPFGWERTVTEDGKVVFVDHQTRRTTYTDPRLAFAIEVKDGDGGNPRFRQKFDASSNAMQVLHGSDLRGRTAVVTGASPGGIGFETARTLAFHGCTVVLACRNLADGECAAAAIRAERPQADCEAACCDLTSLRSVREFAAHFASRRGRLDALVLNAGVYGLGSRLTEDGLDETLQVNYLAQAYLASLLKQAMSETLKPRMVAVSAESHRFSELTVDLLSDRESLSPSGPATHPGPTASYNDSKLLLLMFCLEAHSRWRRHGVRCYPCHPGNAVPSRLHRSRSWLARVALTASRPFAKSLQQAAATPVFAAFHPDVDDLPPGPCYLNNCIPCDPSDLARNHAARDAAWRMTEDLLKEKIPGFKEL